MRELTVGSRRITDDGPAYVVAEIGANHMGSVTRCRDIIEAAWLAGCDAVKLQKRDLATWEAVDPAAWHAPYEGPNSFGATYGEHRAKLEFGWDEYVELKTFAELLGLTFFATAFDIPSLNFLVRLGVPSIKLASASIVNTALIETVAATGIPTILSTGGATEREIELAWNTWADWWAPTGEQNKLAILQCTAEYPCNPADMNLQVISALRREYPSNVIGLSDHDSGISMAPVAYALGARIFEKHFTLDREWRGSDQKFSLTPDLMRQMVRDLKAVREALGDGTKRRLDAEVPALVKMGRTELRQAVNA
jgi:sialic acid synthase